MLNIVIEFLLLLAVNLSSICVAPWYKINLQLLKAVNYLLQVHGSVCA